LNSETNRIVEAIEAVALDFGDLNRQVFKRESESLLRMEKIDILNRFCNWKRHWLFS
jgi:hypothetical protein